MRKRERENPCGVCGHYHKYEEGEVCGVCGHRIPAAEDRSVQQGGAFPSEILKDFLYLGSYDNASRAELLKTLGISRILNTVPACQNLYKNSFTYHCLQDDKHLQFDDAIQFLEQCERDKARVLIHCMSGKNRSAAFVIAYLMKSKEWQFSQSYQWVKHRRPMVELSPAFHQQLLEYGQKIFGSNEPVPVQPLFPSDSVPSFGLGYSKAISNPPVQMFNQPTMPSIFERIGPNTTPSNFVFGSGRNTDQRIMESSAFNAILPTGSETPMDSSS